MPTTLAMKKGIELYKLKAKRDYSNSPQDQYAQLLNTLFAHLKTDLFPLLEKAEQEGKKLSLNEPNESIMVHRYSTQNVSFV